MYASVRTYPDALIVRSAMTQGRAHTPSGVGCRFTHESSYAAHMELLNQLRIGIALLRRGKIVSCLYQIGSLPLRLKIGSHENLRDKPH